MIKFGNGYVDHFRFDPFLKLDNAAQKAVVGWLGPLLDNNRRRARKAIEVDAFNRTVGAVVANALISGDEGFHFSRRLETYSGVSPYRPPWLGSRRLLAVIDGMEKEGLAWVFGGRWGGMFSKGVQSYFEATPLLFETLQALGIGPDVIQRDREHAPVVVLKGNDDQFIRYDPTHESIARQISELRAYNAFIAAQEIALPGWEAPKGASDLTRIYNAGSWELGGRHFGGWWQDVPSQQRRNILINGKTTVERDYGSFMTRALYHLTGQTPPDGDLYEVPKVRELLTGMGVDWETKGRDVVKTILNIAISAKSKAALYSKKTIEELAIPKYVIKLCVPIVLDYHRLILPYLFKGKSLELMNLEANIVHDVIIGGLKEGVVVLPVFDALITRLVDADFLNQMMLERYKARVGFDPVIH